MHSKLDAAAVHAALQLQACCDAHGRSCSGNESILSAIIKSLYDSPPNANVVSRTVTVLKETRCRSGWCPSFSAKTATRCRKAAPLLKS